MSKYKGFIELLELQKYFQFITETEDIEFPDKIYKNIPTKFRYPKSNKDLDLLIDSKFKEYKEKFPVCEFPEFISYTENKIEYLISIIEKELPFMVENHEVYNEDSVYNSAKAYLRRLKEKGSPIHEQEFSIKINGSYEHFEKDLIKLFTTKRNNKIRLPEKDVKQLINQNFDNGIKVSVVKTFSINANKKEVNHILYQVFKKYGKYGEKQLWLDMFNKNFTNYNENNLKNVKDGLISGLKL